MLFNDIFYLEIFLLLVSFYYVLNTNLLILLYTGFLYLMLLGGFALINDADIYIGFLWVIDLGVGVIFFIFILHFTAFLYQKSYFSLSVRHFFYLIIIFAFILTFLFFFSSPNDNTFNYTLTKTWFFQITYMDYYMINYSLEVTDLNTIRDSYFLSNSLEFFLINFSLLFGLISAITLSFFIQRVFNYLNFTQIINFKILNINQSAFFLRNQNFINQQYTSTQLNQFIKLKN